MRMFIFEYMKNIHKLLALLIIICFSCKHEEPMPMIEIYLTNRYINSDEGIPFNETVYWKELDSTERKWYADHYIDSITGRLIYGRGFRANRNDLQDYPFIKNDEILGFHPYEDRIVFDSIVRKRIQYLFPGKRDVQFVLAVDKEPLLTGYFWSGMWSRFPNTYHFYDGTATDIYEVKEKDTAEISYILEYKIPKFRPDTVVKRPAYPLRLINAFKTSNRIRK